MKDWQGDDYGVSIALPIVHEREQKIRNLRLTIMQEGLGAGGACGCTGKVLLNSSPEKLARRRKSKILDNSENLLKKATKRPKVCKSPKICPKEKWQKFTGTAKTTSETGGRAQGLGLRAQGLGLRAQGLGLRASGFGLRASGLGLRA